MTCHNLSATLYATISSIIFEEGISDNVKTSLLTIMKDNYSEVSDEEIISKINTILSSPRINYLVDEIVLVDMFPQTHHVETVCVLERK